MRRNIVKEKSYAFAIEVVKLYQYLCKEKREFVLSKQLLRSGTSVGAMIREAEHAESKADFRHKMAIAQKEINESLYWLDLLIDTGYLEKEKYDKMSGAGIEIIKLVTAIIKSSKANINH